MSERCGFDTDIPEDFRRRWDLKPAPAPCVLPAGHAGDHRSEFCAPGCLHPNEAPAAPKESA